MEKKEKSNNSYQENNININMNNDDTSNKADILLTKIALDAIIKELDEYKKNYIHKKNFIHLQKVNEELIEENKKLLLKIEELENKLKELEERLNVQHAEPIVTNTDVKSTTTSNVKPIKSTTKTDF